MDNPAYIVDSDKKFGSLEQPKLPPIRAHTFEEAVTLTQVGKFHYCLLLISGLCFMSVMVETMGVSVIMPLVKCDLQSTISEQGILASAGFLGIVLSSHAMGFLADTWGRVRTLRYALMLSFASTIISAFSVNTWMLIVFRFLCGFFISGCQACVFSLCGEFHGDRSRVRYVTLLAGFMPIALIYLPSAAIGILPIQIETIVFGLPFSSWRILIIVNSILSLLALFGLYTLPETPKYELVQGNPDGALEILRIIYARNTGRAKSDYPVDRIELESGGASLTDIRGIKDALKLIWSQTVPLFYKERILQTINICFIMFVVFGIAQGTFMWFPTVLNEMVAKSGQGIKTCDIINAMNTTTNQASDACNGIIDIFMLQVLIMIGCAFAGFYVIFAFTIDIIGRKNLLISWLIIAGCCCIIIQWIAEFSVAVILLTLIMGIGNCGGIVSSIAIEFFPTNINAMGMCFIMMMARLGAVAGSNIIGHILFDNCELVFWLFLGVICALCIMGYCLPERKRVKKSKLKCLEST